MVGWYPFFIQLQYVWAILIAMSHLEHATHLEIRIWENAAAWQDLLEQTVTHVSQMLFSRNLNEPALKQTLIGQIFYNLDHWRATWFSLTRKIFGGSRLPLELIT